MVLMFPVAAEMTHPLSAPRCTPSDGLCSPDNPRNQITRVLYLSRGQMGPQQTTKGVGAVTKHTTKSCDFCCSSMYPRAKFGGRTIDLLTHFNKGRDVPLKGVTSLI